MGLVRHRIDSIADIHEKEKEAAAAEKEKADTIELLKGCIMELADVIFTEDGPAVVSSDAGQMEAPSFEGAATIAAPTAAAVAALGGTNKLVELYVGEITRPNATITIQDVPARLRQQVTDAIERQNGADAVGD